MSYTIERYKSGIDAHPFQTFLRLCAEIDQLKADVNVLRAANEILQGMNANQKEQIKTCMEHHMCKEYVGNPMIRCTLLQNHDGDHDFPEIGGDY